MDNDVKAAFDAGNNFQQKLNDTLLGLISANNDRKSEIDALRGDHEELKKNHEAFVVTAERENDLRKNEIKSLEERTQKDNQARITDIAKLEGKLDTENGARKQENSERNAEDKALNDRIDKEIRDRQDAVSSL